MDQGKKLEERVVALLDELEVEKAARGTDAEEVLASPPAFLFFSPRASAVFQTLGAARRLQLLQLKRCHTR